MRSTCNDLKDTFRVIVIVVVVVVVAVLRGGISWQSG